jgi:hypothetical protein
MLLPDPQRRGAIHFYFARSMPYAMRFQTVLVLLTAGFVTQLVSLKCDSGSGVLVGAAFLLAATLLALVKGYTNKPAQMSGAREWRGADAEHLAKIIQINRKSKTWDQSFLDITCGLGGLGFFLAAAVVVGGFMFLLMVEQESLALVWLLDGLVLLPLHWVTGVRSVLTNDPLTVKAQMLLEVVNAWQPVARPGEKMLPQMEVLNTPDGQVPMDAKMILQVEPLGQAFLGLQVQVCINNVQGADYPYLYCVLVARPGLQLHQQLHSEPPSGIVTEPQTQEDVEILIVRQYTTKTSGYHTDATAALRIFMNALELTRHLKAV